MVLWATQGDVPSLRPGERHPREQLFAIHQSLKRARFADQRPDDVPIVDAILVRGDTKV